MDFSFAFQHQCRAASRVLDLQSLLFQRTRVLMSLDVVDATACWGARPDSQKHTDGVKTKLECTDLLPACQHEPTEREVWIATV